MTTVGFYNDKLISATDLVNAYNFLIGKNVIDDTPDITPTISEPEPPDTIDEPEPSTPDITPEPTIPEPLEPITNKWMKLLAAFPVAGMGLILIKKGLGR